MTPAEWSRSILRHGVIVVALSFVMGVVVGAVGPSDAVRGRLWLAGHLTCLLLGVWMIAIAFMVPRLRLGQGGLRALFVVTVPFTYVAVVVLGFFANALGFPSPILTPELPAIAAWQTGIIVSAIALVSLGGFVQVGLLVAGLRGSD